MSTVDVTVARETLVYAVQALVTVAAAYRRFREGRTTDPSGAIINAEAAAAALDRALSAEPPGVGQPRLAARVAEEQTPRSWGAATLTRAVLNVTSALAGFTLIACGIYVMAVVL